MHCKVYAVVGCFTTKIIEIVFVYESAAKNKGRKRELNRTEQNKKSHTKEDDAHSHKCNTTLPLLLERYHVAPEAVFM